MYVLLVKNRQFEPTLPLFGTHIAVDPIGISPKCLASDNQSTWAIVWRCLRDPAFSCFGTVPACDIRTAGRTDRHMMTAYAALAYRHAVIISLRNL